MSDNVVMGHAGDNVDQAAIEAALSRGEDGVLAELCRRQRPEMLPEILRTIATQAIKARGWAMAEAALSRLVDKDVASQLQLTLARNFIALRQHRPSVYEVLVSTVADARFSINVSVGGMATISFEQPGEAPQCFSLGGEPMAALASMWVSLKAEIGKGTPLALCGLGDGYLLGALAQQPPTLYLSMQQTIHLVEPHPQVVMLCMMIHDYAGDAGPIKQPRFRWHIGSQWATSLGEDLLGDLMTPWPAVLVKQGLGVPTMSTVLADLQEQLAGQDQARQNEIGRYYAGVTQADWLDVFGSFPARPPRVLLITTRFSTVLQYSTAHAAEAFGQLGWETQTVIEPSDWQRFGTMMMRKSLAEFKPDLVFQIDHLRHEHGEVFPPQLPFACWIQDHLHNLCNPTAGATVNLRDFVLSSVGSLFVRQHGYPRRQIIDLPQLARCPLRPTQWTSDGDDLVYVSNCAASATTIREQIVHEYAQPPILRTLVERCCDRIEQTYRDGGTISTHYDVRLIVQEIEHAVGVELSNPSQKDVLINTLFDRLNNVLYRHQALGWAAQVAADRGLTMGLFGKGWQTHPSLAAFARGPVTPGAAMEALTRKTKINLQLEPFACITHARLLNGLFAGGFFLIRDHPFNHLAPELLNFVDRHFDQSVCTVDDARRLIKPHHAAAMEETLRRCACLGEQIDPVAMVRDWQRAGTLVPNAAMLPRLKDVLFTDAASLGSAVNRFIENASLREQISDEQRQNTQSRLTYRAGLDRVIRAIGRLIAGESREQAKAA